MATAGRLRPGARYGRPYTRARRAGVFFAAAPAEAVRRAWRSRAATSAASAARPARTAHGGPPPPSRGAVAGVAVAAGDAGRGRLTANVRVFTTAPVPTS